VDRSRVEARLTRALSFPIAMLQGAAGSGKSFALRDALRREARAHVVFDVGPEHATLARFVQGLTDALAAHAPGARVAFGSAYDRAILSEHAGQSLAVWLHEHIKGLDLTIAIDNAHNADGASVQAFLGRLIDRPGDGLRWVLACRSCDLLPVANWLAGSRMGLPVEEDELAFEIEEIAQLARERGVALSESHARDVHERTAGWATGVAFLLQIAASGRDFDGPVRAYEPIIEKVLADCDAAALQALFSTAYLPDLSEELLTAVGGSTLALLVGGLRARAPFLFVETPTALRLHGLLRDELRARMAASGEGLAQVARDQAAAALTMERRYVDVLGLQLEGHIEGCVPILDDHGIELIEQGHADLIDAAIGRLLRDGVELPARVVALRAIVDSRLGRMDTAEAWFNQALAHAENDDARMIEIKYLYACDLLRRDRLDCVPLLRAHVDDPDITPSLRAAIQSALAEGLQLANEPEAARAAIAAAIEIERGVGDPALHARVLARAAYVFLYQDDYDAARLYAQAAAQAATAASQFTVATGAYSVLYVIAFDSEDVDAALHNLGLLLENCLKSGNLQFQFYCLACTFEIEMERNNVAAVRRIDDTLRSFDMDLGGSVSDEAFFPGDALRSAAHGDFERAYRLLHPTAMHQAGAERIAQRWSEVALYAAGAMRNLEATEALDHGLAALAECGNPSARSTRARLYFSLTLALVGRLVEAASLLEHVRNESNVPARLRVIEGGVAALCRYASGEDNYHDIAKALRAMHERECGGIARLFESLPSRLLFRREAAV